MCIRDSFITKLPIRSSRKPRYCRSRFEIPFVCNPKAREKERLTNTKLENQNGHRQKITPARRDRKKLETPGTELNQTKPVYSVAHIYTTKQVTQEKRERKNTKLDSRQQVTQRMRDRKNAKSKRKRTRPTAHSVTHILDHTSHARNAGRKKCKIKAEVNQTSPAYSVTHIPGHASHARRRHGRTGIRR